MRPIVAALLLTVLAAAPFAGPARAQERAQEKVFTPAPVSRLGPSAVTPADRAGRPNGAERAAPFSGLPDTLNAAGGQPTPANGGAPDRSTAPAPSVSR